jgi:hypothetical protein
MISNMDNIFTEKCEGMRPLGRHTRRGEGNIRMDEGNRVGRCELDASDSG